MLSFLWWLQWGMCAFVVLFVSFACKMKRKTKTERTHTHTHSHRYRVQLQFIDALIHQRQQLPSDCVHAQHTLLHCSTCHSLSNCGLLNYYNLLTLWWCLIDGMIRSFFIITCEKFRNLVRFRYTDFGLHFSDLQFDRSSSISSALIWDISFQSGSIEPTNQPYSMQSALYILCQCELASASFWLQRIIASSLGWITVNFFK